MDDRELRATVRSQLTEVSLFIESLLVAEKGEDGTYEVSAVEIEISELEDWRNKILNCKDALTY